MAKYNFTPEMDKEILYTYSINTDSKPRVLNLVKKFNMPRWGDLLEGPENRCGDVISSEKTVGRGRDYYP